MVSPDIIRQESKRILEKYFDLDKIRSKTTREERSKEFMRQVNRMKGLGIIGQLKENYTISNYLFKESVKGYDLKKPYEPLRLKGFQEFEFREARASKKASLKGVTERTGTRQVFDKKFEVIRAWEKWKDGETREVLRDSKGRFIKR